MSGGPRLTKTQRAALELERQRTINLLLNLTDAGLLTPAIRGKLAALVLRINERLVADLRAVARG